MPDFVINGFKYGLDTRKDVLSSQPGTLVTCNNGYINAGGEIEKRKQFGEFADCTILDDDGNQTAFGLLSAASGLLIFGHAIPNGQGPAGLGSPEVATTIPTGLTYRCLIHPQLGGYDDPDEAEYVYARHGMQAVVFAENFNGFFFVAATFKDGNTFLFYEDDPQNQQDGTPVFYRAVFHSWLGHVFWTTTSVIFDPAIEQIGWAVGDSGLQYPDSSDNLVQGVLSPVSDYFEAVGTVESTNGSIGIRKIDQDGESTVGERPVAGFRITVNTGTFTVIVPETITIGLGSPTLTIASAISAQSTAAETCAAIAEQINDYTSSHGYSALSKDDSVFVYMPISFGEVVTANMTVNVTTGTVVAAGAPPTVLVGVINPTPLEVVLALSKKRATVVKGDAKVEASGGAGNYKFVWKETFPGSGGGISLTQANPNTPDEKNSEASFSINLEPNTIAKGNFLCVITDAAPNTVEVPLTVSLQTTYKSGR